MPKKHGHTTKTTQSPTYTSYCAMIGRCHNPRNSKFKSYGAKGILVCERWRSSFQNFLSDMGVRPPGTTLDRIDGKLGYNPENCRWATPKVQQSNISTNVLITFNGKTQHVSAWAEQIGLSATNLAWRLRNGWTVHDALTIPPRLGNRTRTTGQVLIEYNGRTQCLSRWAEEYNMSISLLRLRLNKGMSIEQALTTPKGIFVTKKCHAPTP